MNKSLIAVISLILMLPLIFAQQPPQFGPPHQYYGTVTINNAPAKDGLLVTAKINNKDAAAKTTKDGKYGYSPIFFVQDPFGNFEGQTVNFYVQNIDTGETTIFSNANSTKTQVNLDLFGDLFCSDNLCGSSESCSTCSSDCGTCPPASGNTTGSSGGGASGGGGGSGGGDSGGGGGGGGGFTFVCNQDWECTDWSGCVNDGQTRGCNFVKVPQHAQDEPCPTIENGPPTSQKCQLGTCVSDWVCSGWLPCISASQIRVCVDANRCAVETNRPEEQRPCEAPEGVSQATTTDATVDAPKNISILSKIKDFFTSITGSAVTNIDAKSSSVVAIIIGFLIIIGIVMLVIYKNKLFLKNQE